MSFAATAEQMRRRQKTVTRRLGWRFLKPGDRLLAVVAYRGVPKAQREELGVIEVEEVSRELLTAITQCEIYREGFRLGRAEFVELFCRMNRCTRDVEVTWIRFRFVEPEDSR